MVTAVPDPSTPTALRVVAAVALAQVLGLVAYAIVVVVAAVRGDESSAGNAALLAVLVLAWAVGLAVAARGLVDRRRWARAPALLSELLLFAVGVPLAQNGAGIARWAGVLLVVSGAVGTVAVLTPSVTAALDGPRERPS
jgi:hypothetical protein